MKALKLYLLFSFMSHFFFANAQEDYIKDSLGFSFESEAAFSNKDYLPFWIVNNQEGRFTDRGANAWLEGGVTGWYKLDSNFSVDYQIEAVLNSDVKNSFLKQYNASFHWKKLRLSAGRFYNENEGIASELRSGSFYQSRNAVPIPRVGLAVNEYIAVPFTRNVLHFKGSLYHGWFESDRSLSNTWLHEKSFYVKIGKTKKFNLSWGLVHAAMWGGTDQFGTTWTRGFKEDYFKVVTASSSSDAETLSNINLEGSNRQGNHLGIWDIQLSYTNKLGDFEIYYHRPWEDLKSLNKIFDKDALFGFAWQQDRKKTALVNAIVVEFMHTRNQGGPGIPDSVAGQSNYGYDYGGRDDYYNNWLYRSGWTYEGRVIGNPLFTTDERAEKYFETINNYRVKIVNNRFWAIHLGVESKPFKNWLFNAKFTMSRNYGTYAGLNGGRFKWGSREPDFDNSEYSFLKPLHQINSVVESTYSPPCDPNIRFNLGVAADIGEMSESYGVFIGLRLDFPVR